MTTYVELVFKAFLGATARVRWLLLTTTLLSSLIAVNSYLERFGAKRNAIESVIENDLKLRATLLIDFCTERKMELSKCVQESGDQMFQQDDAQLFVFHGRMRDLRKSERELLARILKDPSHGTLGLAFAPDLQKDIDKFVGKKYVAIRTQNTFELVEAPVHKLPLLELKVDGDDYLPVMVIMLTVMAAAVWLNIGNLETTLLQLKMRQDAKDYLEASRLYFTFLFPTSDGKTNFISHMLLVMAIWMPLGAVIFGILLDVEPILRAIVTGDVWLVYASPSMLSARIVCIVVCFSFLLAFAILGSQASGRIQKIVSITAKPDAAA